MAAVRAGAAARDAAAHRAGAAAPPYRHRGLDLRVRSKALRTSHPSRAGRRFLLSRGLALGVVLYASALVVATVFGISTDAAILYVGLFSVAYTSLGGIAADIWSDVLQLVVLWVGTVLSCGYLLFQYGDSPPDGGAGGSHAGARARLCRSGAWGGLRIPADVLRRSVSLPLVLRVRPEPGPTSPGRPR